VPAVAPATVRTTGCGVSSPAPPSAKCSVTWRSTTVPGGHENDAMMSELVAAQESQFPASDVFGGTVTM